MSRCPLQGRTLQSDDSVLPSIRINTFVDADWESQRREPGHPAMFGGLDLQACRLQIAIATEVLIPAIDGLTT